MSTRLLFIEDEPSTRTAMYYVLTNAGYEVHSYSSVEEASQHLLNGDVDLALIDTNLPGRRGDDFARELHEKWPLVRIIIWTANANIDQIKLLVPAAMVVRKPVDVEALLELVRCELAKADADKEEPPGTIPFPSAG